MQKKRRLAWGWFALIPLLILLLGVLQLLGPDPALQVSPQTTYITSPLGPDGLPDYAQHLYQARGNQAPEENAAVLYWKAIWPGELSPDQYDLVCNALNMDVPSADESLLPVNDELILEGISGTFVETSDQDVTAAEILEQLSVAPWTRQQFPVLGEWMDLNSVAFQWLIEGSQRPKYFSPSPSLLDGRAESMLSMVLPALQGLRSAAQGLTVRAMGHLGEGNTGAAWQDLLTAHRMARHAASGDLLINQLVAFAMHAMACRGTQTLLHHGQLSVAEAQGVLADLRALPPLPDLSQAIGQGERFFYLDTATRLATAKLGSAEATGFANNQLAPLMYVRVDWNVALRNGNRRYDRMSEIAKLPRAERLVAVEDMEEEIDELTQQIPGRIAGSLFSGRARSELVSDLLLALFLPAVNSASNAADRAQVLHALTQTAAYLTVYRATHGEYPKALSQLVPEFFDEVPLDLYSGNPLKYVRSGEGYLLYSVFEDGRDHEGNDVSGQVAEGTWIAPWNAEPPDPGKADLVVLVPRMDWLNRLRKAPQHSESK